jgi:peptide-methionine (S)-S-oxide reductase
MESDKALFAAGCFWGVQAAYDKLEGVIDTVAGYSGGHTINPSYKEVCGGETGHAEAVLVVFDPKKIAYEKLLEVFWSIHDPTTKNWQGPDIGSQYRSAIFYFTNEQKRAAEKTMNEEQRKLQRSITTEITVAGPFYPAEDYHQHYHKKNPLIGCVANILKKKR